MLVIVDVQSVSDIITNSSSEVFIINSNNNSLIELIEGLGCNTDYYITMLTTDDDVKNFLIDICVNRPYYLDYIDGYISHNILKNIFVDSWDFNTETCIENGISVEKLIETFFPFYKELTGKMILKFDDECYYPEWVNTIINFSHNNNIIVFEDRV